MAFFRCTIFCLAFTGVKLASLNKTNYLKFSIEDCDNFFEAACPLEEDNMLEFKHRESAQQCQLLCRSHPTCTYFTWFDTQCFLLLGCDFTVTCPCCVSGPGSLPDVGSCDIGCGEDTTLTSSSTPVASTGTTSYTTEMYTTNTTNKSTTTSTTTSINTTTTATTVSPTSISSTTTSPSSCGAEWHDHSCSCYSLISGYTNLAECNQACATQGGDLTSIHDQAENDFLEQLLRANNKTIAWIGAVFFSGRFVWLDNSYVNYLNWEEGQPDHHEWGDCIGMAGGEGGNSPGTWDDVDCREYLGSDCICKKKIM